MYLAKLTKFNLAKLRKQCKCDSVLLALCRETQLFGASPGAVVGAALRLCKEVPCLHSLRGQISTEYLCTGRMEGM